MSEKLWDSMAWYGVVCFGWLCCCRPSPHPLPPVSLWGPSWEDPLFCAGRRTSEWMSKSSGGLLQWWLFVYTSQSRHTSLAAQPTDNLWCSNRWWVCSCTETLSLGCLSDCLLSHLWNIYINKKSWLSWQGWTSKLDVSSSAKRHREVSWCQWSRKGPGELALHHRDVRNLPPRNRQNKTEAVFSAAIFWWQSMK